MITKIFNLIVVLIMMQGVFGLTGCNEISLVEYKTTKSTKLQEYADAKGRDNYTEDGWAVICKAVEDGKKAIEDATTKPAVTKAFNEATVVIDAVEEKMTVSDLMRSGAYFITDISWELYIRNWVADIEHLINGIDEEWIQRAIDGTLTYEDTKGLFISPPNKNYMWVAVYDDKITVNSEVYRFVRNGDSYTGQTLNSTITFSLLGDILTIKKGGNIINYKLDDSFQISENEINEFSAPTDVTYTFGGQGLNYACFDWHPSSGSGWFGAGIELKKADSEDFSLVKIDYPYQYTFVAQFRSTDFSQGINVIRIYYIGGPSLDRNSKQVYLIQNSEYKTFNIIVNNDGAVIIEESNK